MANLRETSTWEAGIYQLETSDPVMGGENGIDNRAPRQLANRTLWLKNELVRQIGVVNSGKLGKTENAVSASKLATARNIAMTGDGSWNVNFDGSQNASATMTLANSGVTAGSYNSVTVDAKGRVTRGLTQTHGLVTATTATGTANTATTNGNTFLNIVASGVGSTSSVGSSTQITGTNGITVSSDTAGKLIVGQVLANSLTDTSTAKALTALQGKVLDEKIATINNTLTSHRHTWSEIDGKPSTFVPSSHTHTISNITDYDVRQISTEDLDSITKWGIYGQGANNQSLTERNYPVPNEAGTLEVMPGTYGLRQRFTTFASHRTFERSRNNAQTGWNAWTELSNTWDAIRGKPNNLATTTSNVASATKLQTARSIAMTGDGSWHVNFDGSQNATGALTLAKSGVTAGSYNSVTVDAKGRVTAGLTQTHGLVTATTATGTANTATTNSNTFLNIVASGVGRTASVGSSTQITGNNGISVSSDTAGKLIVTRDSNSPTATKLATARTINGVAFDGTQNITINDNTKAPAVHRHNWSEIDGKPAIITHPTQITSGDLDDYKEIGVYYCHTNVHARDIANTPSNLAFALEVVRAAGVVQIFREYETAIVYMRAFYRKWSPWKRLATTEDNAPTATKLATARTLALTGAVTGSVNFDGSGNVSLATALKGIDRREYTGTLTPSHNSFKSQKVPMTGSVEVLPNGRMVQYFTFVCPVLYFHKHGLSAFYREKLGVSSFTAEDSPHLELPLWTPMPHKIQEARIHLSANLNHNAWGEAQEWVYDWDAIFNHHANIKDKAYFAFRRWAGNQDEPVTFTIVVEGY
ncbi:pyocin knob domain-containing protein [Moraxella bovoculi]|uniref:pyocin knob domain-containing protein n=1 Tax=Moraxella bovoculi TaxID=386891 RepID=UPI00062449D1|nr:pyocin knob domain-containing protein [Moraxella bovoculi]AKG11499.1 hypothetical protein AAX07_05275 [Moraxella bovoculi]